MLSGIGIDANVEPFEGSMEDMKAAAQEAGVAVVENTSFTQEVDTVTAEAEDTTDIPTYYEKYDVASQPIEGHNKVMSGEGDTLLEQTSEHYPVTKSVVVGESVPVNEKKQTTGSKVSTSNAAGQKANIPAVKITNANKSVGNSVANSTKQ
jgi:hypothetical protein